MLVGTHEVFWHEQDGKNLPVFGIDLGRSGRLVTGGADGNVRLWSLSSPPLAPVVRHIAVLSRHTKPVNQVRFSPTMPEMIASASDDTLVYIWQQNKDGGTPQPTLEDQGDKEPDSESWSVLTTLHGHISDVTSIAWAPNGKRLVSGEIQHRIIIWNIASGAALMAIPAHSKFVKGVAWDPQSVLLASQSCDKTCAVFRINYNPRPKDSLCALVKTLKSVKKPCSKDSETTLKNVDLFADDSVLSYFRRPCWSPDGTFLVTPTGIHDDICCSLVWHRDHLEKPLYIIKNASRPTTTVSFSPLFYKLNASSSVGGTPRLPLLYRMIFAIASNDGSLTVHDTEQDIPLAFVSGLHLSQITDLAWSPNGRMLVVSSSDGYLSTISFESNELGEPIQSSEYGLFGIPIIAEVTTCNDVKVEDVNENVSPVLATTLESKTLPIPPFIATEVDDAAPPRRIIPQLQPRRVELIRID